MEFIFKLLLYLKNLGVGINLVDPKSPGTNFKDIWMQTDLFHEIHTNI